MTFHPDVCCCCDLMMFHDWHECLMSQSVLGTTKKFLVQLYGLLAIKLYCKSKTIALQQPAYKHTDTDCQLTDRQDVIFLKSNKTDHFYTFL